MLLKIARVNMKEGIKMIDKDKDLIVKYLKSKIDKNDILKENIIMEIYLRYTMGDTKSFRNYLINKYTDHSLVLKDIRTKKECLNYKYEIRMHEIYQEILLDVLSIYNKLEEEIKIKKIVEFIIKNN